MMNAAAPEGAPCGGSITTGHVWHAYNLPGSAWKFLRIPQFHGSHESRRSSDLREKKNASAFFNLTTQSSKRP
jgi:hypothetical protein